MNFTIDCLLEFLVGFVCTVCVLLYCLIRIWWCIRFDLGLLGVSVGLLECAWGLLVVWLILRWVLPCDCFVEVTYLCLI